MGKFSIIEDDESEEKMNIANNWNDYKILDMADGQKL